MHKTYETKTAPPPRPIISGVGSMTENISLYVQHHIQNISKTHPSYLQDTPDFLRTIETINEGPNLPPNALLVSMDATALFDNIPHGEGLETLEAALDERIDLKVPTQFIKKLMQLVLEWNLFTFHNASYLQQVGVAMGTHPAPDYSDIFMARKIDRKI